MIRLLLVALAAAQPAADDFVRPYIRRHLQVVRGCYERALVREPRLAARVTLRLVVNGLGRVIAASATGAPSGELRECVLAAARAWSLPGWPALIRRCDWGSECASPVRANASERLIVTYPLVLMPSRSIDELEQLRAEARACWDQALALGTKGDAGAHVSRHFESDGFEVVSVEQTALPPPAAACLARAASRHLGGERRSDGLRSSGFN